MNPEIRSQFDARARVLKALAHPTRLFLVDALTHGERCVCDLTALVGADISTVSKHLSILRNAGIIADDKRGAQVFYQLKTPCVLNFFSCVESVLRAAAPAPAATAERSASSPKAAAAAAVAREG